jgi:hypothetical protein
VPGNTSRRLTAPQRSQRGPPDDNDVASTVSAPLTAWQSWIRESCHPKSLFSSTTSGRSRGRPKEVDLDIQLLHCLRSQSQLSFTLAIGLRCHRSLLVPQTYARAHIPAKQARVLVWRRSDYLTVRDVRPPGFPALCIRIEERRCQTVELITVACAASTVRTRACGGGTTIFRRSGRTTRFAPFATSESQTPSGHTVPIVIHKNGRQPVQFVWSVCMKQRVTSTPAFHGMEIGNHKSMLRARVAVAGLRNKASPSRQMRVKSTFVATIIT